MVTFWQEEEFEQICRRELLTDSEKAVEIEKSISVKEHERLCHYFVLTKNRFRSRRPDGRVSIIEHYTS